MQKAKLVYVGLFVFSSLSGWRFFHSLAFLVGVKNEIMFVDIRSPYE